MDNFENKKSKQDLFIQLAEAVKALQWNMAIPPDDNVSGVVIGTEKYIITTVGELDNGDDYDLMLYEVDKPNLLN